MARVKVKATRRRRLTPYRGEVRAQEPFEPTDAPLDEKKENLYAAVERTQAFLYGPQRAGEAMETVRQRYPAPLYFVESNRRALQRAGLNRMDAFYYAMIPALSRTGLSQQWGANPKLDRLSKMSAYLKTLYIGVHVECFYLILMNRLGKLIRPVLLQRGGVDNAPFYLSQLLSSALTEEASFIVLAHNHPGGTLRPSREDVKCTLRALNAFAPLRIALLDHVIVAGDAVFSIRASAVVPDVLWTGMQPNSRIVRDWLEPEE